MMSKLRYQTSVHESGHAVLGAEFGLVAAHLARDLDVHSQIEACEKDAIVALAGLAANRRENPRFPIHDVIIEGKDTDTDSARIAIIKMICLKDGQPTNPTGSCQHRTGYVGQDTERVLSAGAKNCRPC
jgi:hypothetical protein